MRPRHDAQPRTNDLAALRATRAIDAAVPRTPTSASPSRISNRSSRPETCRPHFGEERQLGEGRFSLNLADAADLLQRCNSILAKQKSDITIIETGEMFQVLDPGRPFAVANTITWANFEEDRAEEAITAAMQRYREKSLPFRWFVFPNSRPADLSARLLARKPTAALEHFGFAAACAAAQSFRAPEISLELLCPANLKDYLLAGSESFAEISQASVDSIKGLAQETLARPNPDYLLFLARLKGEPVGFCGIRILREGGKVAGMLGGAGVRPAFRHRGVMRAMIKQRAQEMSRRGIEFLIVYSNAQTSAPIFRKLGFDEVFPFQIFEFSVSETSAS